MQTNPYEDLQAVINGLKRELIDYEASPKKIQFVVEKRTDLINRLTSVLVSITEFDTDGLVTTLSSEINKITRKDPEINGLLIKVEYVKDASKIGIISIKLHS